ncbi:MAG: hypothetical protein IID46_01075 [Planctomycetes bacterium]|nr:hypothetical protein [Planctomycetota bacterium]
MTRTQAIQVYLRKNEELIESIEKGKIEELLDDCDPKEYKGTWVNIFHCKDGLIFQGVLVFSSEQNALHRWLYIKGEESIHTPQAIIRKDGEPIAVTKISHVFQMPYKE